MKTHELKTWPEPFEAIRTGIKRFEVRENDRGFAVGDVLLLREWDIFLGYTRRSLRAVVTYIAPGGEWGLPSNICVMSLGSVETADAE